MDDQIDSKKANNSSWEKLKNSCFKVFVEMLKTREVLKVDAVVLLVVGFLQMYGTMLDDHKYNNWDDDIAGDFVYGFFKVIRVVPLIISEKAVSLYRLFFALGIF